MKKLVGSAVGLVAILGGAARWLVLLPRAGVQGHPLQGRGWEDGLATLGKVFRQENAWGMLAGSVLVGVGVLVVLRILWPSRVPARRRAKPRALLFWGLAGGGTVTVHALLVVVHLLRP